MKYIKKIPDANIESSCKRLLASIKKLTETEKSTLVRLALKYPPATKALLGCMVDEMQQYTLSELLYKTLNPITTYKLTGAVKILSATEKWNII